MSDHMAERYANQTAVLEIRLEVRDVYSRRLRWNGQPMASDPVREVLLDAVAVLEGKVKSHGIDIVRTSYGVTGA